MRIIGGRYKGFKIHPPQNLPVRPTTDVAKEALFNILSNQFDLAQCSVLDLFSGTGNISLEFASRGAVVTSVDKHPACINFLKQQAQKLELTNIKAEIGDIFKWVKTLDNNNFDIIFADPPFDLNRIPELHRSIFETSFLSTDSILIIENPSLKSFANLDGFLYQRTYGGVSFNFFQKK